ncbi:MAG: DUF222 domain-containing protein [Acidimicrobiales bacterium]
MIYTGNTSGPVRVRSGLGELDDLSDVLSLVDKVDLTAVDPEQLADVVVDLFAIKNRIDALATKSVNALAESGVFDGSKRKSVATFLKVNTHISGGVANRWKRAAHQLRDMPATAASFRAGRISFEHVLLMVSVYNHKQCRWAFEAAEAADLIPVAETKDWVYFKACCERFIQVADPSQGEDRAKDQAAKQKLHLSPTFDGMYRIDGWLTPIDGELVDNELTRLEKVEYLADWAEAKRRLGFEPSQNDLVRTRAQRKAAALAKMAQRSASLGVAPVSSLPCLNVNIDWETFQAITSQMAGLDAELPADGERQTEAGHNVSPTQAAQLLMEGHVRRVVYGPDGHILDFGYKTRFFTGGLREAVMLRDRYCAEPGCGLPARLCEIDHVVPREKRGATSESNGRARCSFHNGLKGANIEPEAVITDHRPFLTWYRPASE